MKTVITKFIEEQIDNANPTKEDMDKALILMRLLQGFMGNYQSHLFKGHPQHQKESIEMEDMLFKTALEKYSDEGYVIVIDGKEIKLIKKEGTH